MQSITVTVLTSFAGYLSLIQFENDSMSGQ